MRYVSLFSGIEAASVAWEPLGWEPVAFADVDPFSAAVLSERYPEVPNLGDVSSIDWSDYAGTVDLIVGGSPCQAFSIAGKREGLMDERGQLMLEYVRAVRDVHPRWLLWENVPGVLSQSGGDAFDTLQRELEKCGYSLAWRTLDAQFAGVAQRRRRVFLVGHSRVGCAAAVLFERESLHWDSPTSLAKRQALAERAGRSVENAGDKEPSGGCGVGRYRLSDLRAADRDMQVPRAYRAGASGGKVTWCVQGDIARGAHLGCNGTGACHELSYTLNTIDVPVVTRAPFCMADSNGRSAVDIDLAGTLTVAGDPPTVSVNCRNYDVSVEILGNLLAKSNGGTSLNYQNPIATKSPTGGMALRRLTPRECERLQGFPDDWTRISYRGRPADECPDSLRYKALGNSMAVPVMRWIGWRIDQVDKIER